MLENRQRGLRARLIGNCNVERRPIINKGFAMPPKHFSKGPRLSILVSTCLLIASHAFTAPAALIELRGEIQFTVNRKPDGAPVKSPLLTFICKLGTNYWSMDNNWSENGTQHWEYDGTNFYDLIRQTNESTRVSTPPSFLDRAALPASEAIKHPTLAIHPPNENCPRGGPDINIPWLALCSGSYLSQSNRIVPVVNSFLAHSPDGFGYTDLTEQNSDALALPKSIKLLTSKTLYFQSVSNFNFENNIPEDIAVSPRSPWPDGLLKAEYHSLRETNFHGSVIPLSFEYVQYRIDKASKISPYATAEGTITYIGEATQPTNLFSPSANQTIMDFRFPTPNGKRSSIMYNNTNDHVLPTSDTNLKAIKVQTEARSARFENQWQSIQELNARKPRRRRLFFIGFSLCLLLLPPLILRFRKTQQQVP